MPKPQPNHDPKPSLSPVNAFVLYCLARPQDRREAIREMLGDAAARMFLADPPNGSAAQDATGERASRG